MNQTALEIWKQKLAYLQEQEAIAADASVKFQLQQQSEECRLRIEELEKRNGRKIEEKKFPVIFPGGLSTILISCLVIIFAVPSTLYKRDRLENQPSTASVNSSPKIDTYRNPKYGIFVDYPKDWKKQELGGSWEDSGAIVKFLPKKSNFSSQVTISLNEYPIAPPTLNEVVAQVTKPLSADRILKSTPTILADSEAYLIEYNWQDALNHHLKVRQVLMVKKDKVYTIIYTAEKKEFERFLPIVEEVMLKSFQVDSRAKF